jgi:hypothetical protein
MSNGAQTPVKKGLHPLAWVGIGCGVILVLVVVAMTVGGFFLARGIKNVAEDFEDNPGLAAARLVVKASPELEEVSTDEAAGTMTVRNTQTGELITLDFEDIKQGKFSWTADGEEVSVDVSEAESGTVRIQSSDGEGVQITTGAAASDEFPDWVPVYPGTEPKGLGTMSTGGSVNGSFSLTTDDSVAQVLDFYRDTLKEAGYDVSVNTYSGEGAEGAMINGSLEAEKKNVVVIVGTEGSTTTASVNYSSRSE